MKHILFTNNTKRSNVNNFQNRNNYFCVQCVHCVFVRLLVRAMINGHNRDIDVVIKEEMGHGDK